MVKYIRLNLSNEAFNAAVPEGTNGVYTLHVINSNNTPMPLSRLLGTDHNGILYIGSAPSRTLQERLADFRKTVLPRYKTSSHDAAAHYTDNSEINSIFPIDMLAFSIQESNDADTLETRLIKEYRNQYGEIPPLNSQNK